MSDYEYDYTEYLYRPPQQFVAVPDEFIMTPNYAPYSPRSASPLVKVIHASHTAAIAKNDDGWARMCSDAWSDDWADEPVGSEEVGPLLNDPD